MISSDSSVVSSSRLFYEFVKIVGSRKFTPEFCDAISGLSFDSLPILSRMHTAILMKDDTPLDLEALLTRRTTQLCPRAARPSLTTRLLLLSRDNPALLWTLDKETSFQVQSSQDPDPGFVDD